MPARLVLLLSVALLTASCGGGDKHLPSSNPPEYDPKKVYTAPTAPPSAPAVVQPVVPPPSSSAKSPPMDPVALAKALEDADRTRDILEKVESLDAKAQIHAILEAMMMGEQAPPELRTTFKESFETRKAQIHQAFDKQYDQLQQALDEEQKLPAMQPLLRKSGGSEPFSLYRVNARGVRGAQLSWMHLVDLPRGITVSLESDCCGAWHITTIPSGAFDGDGFNVEIRSGGRYWPDNDHIGEGDAITSSTKVVAGNKGAIIVKILKKNRAVVSRCPSASGIVPGDASIYEELGYSVTAPGSNSRAGIFVHDQAKTEAQTDEEGFVKEIKMEITAADLDGETGQVLRQASGRAVKKRDMPVVCSGCDQRVADAAKRLADMVSWNYYNAEQKWRKPPFKADACVEIIFTPPTKTKRFVPSESTPVKTELRTKKEQAIVPAKFKEARELPRERNGTVSPREAQSQPGAPATFTYQAPPTRVRHSGFWVGAVSRAGTTDGEWELAPAAYVLEFKSHIVQEPLNLPNPPFGLFMSVNGFDAHVQATVPLRRRDDGQWVGEGVMQFATRTLTQPASCEIRIQGAGTTTFHVNGGSISSDPEPFAVNLIILPGQSGEVAETHCISSNDPKLKELMAKANPGVGFANEAHSVTKGGGWSGAFNFTRFRTFNMNKGGYEIGGWTPVRDSDVIARKTITVNCGMGLSACREETTLTLRFADEPDAAASPTR